MAKTDWTRLEIGEALDGLNPFAALSNRLWILDKVESDHHAFMVEMIGELRQILANIVGEQ